MSGHEGELGSLTCSGGCPLQLEEITRPGDTPTLHS